MKILCLPKIKFLKNLHRNFVYIFFYRGYIFGKNNCKRPLIFLFVFFHAIFLIMEILGRYQAKNIQRIYIKTKNSKGLCKISCFLICIFIIIFIHYNNIINNNHGKILTYYNLISYDKLKKKTNYLNITFDDLNNSYFALLSIQFLHNSSRESIKKPIIIQSTIEHINSQNSLDKIFDTPKIYGKIKSNSNFIPFYFIYTENISQINIYMKLFSSYPYIEYVNIKWEIESKKIFLKSKIINNLMQIITTIILLFFIFAIRFSIISFDYKCKFTLILLILTFFCHFQFCLIFQSIQISCIISYLFRCILFCFYFIFWRFKVFNFEINEFKNSTKLQPLYLGVISSILMIFLKLSTEFNLMSTPLRFDGSPDLYDFDLFLHIAVAFATGSAFWLNFADIISIYSKSEKIMRKKYLINNIYCMFASLFNAFMFLNKVKNKEIIENQIEIEIKQILWDFAIFFEVFASQTIMKNVELISPDIEEDINEIEMKEKDIQIE